MGWKENAEKINLKSILSPIVVYGCVCVCFLMHTDFGPRFYFELISSIAFSGQYFNCATFVYPSIYFLLTEYRETECQSPRHVQKLAQKEKTKESLWR